MQPEAARRTSARLENCPDEGPVVLLVTGDGELREAAARGLSARGFRVVPAAHGGHALLACMEAPRVDVAVIELSMEDVSGPVLAERLRRRCPNLRSLYLASAGTPECEGILVRPFTRDDLIGRLLRLLPVT